MPSSLRCSFCRKSEHEVSKLVAGPNVYICDACAKIAIDIMNDPHAAGVDRKPSLLNRLLGSLFRHRRNMFATVS